MVYVVPMCTLCRVMKILTIQQTQPTDFHTASETKPFYSDCFQMILPVYHSKWFIASDKITDRTDVREWEAGF
jgi:hypothetical protein